MRQLLTAAPPNLPRYQPAYPACLRLPNCTIIIIVFTTCYTCYLLHRYHCCGNCLKTLCLRRRGTYVCVSLLCQQYTSFVVVAVNDFDILNSISIYIYLYLHHTYNSTCIYHTVPILPYLIRNRQTNNGERQLACAETGACGFNYLHNSAPLVY